MGPIKRTSTQRNLVPNISDIQGRRYVVCCHSGSTSCLEQNRFHLFQTKQRQTCQDNIFIQSAYSICYTRLKKVPLWAGSGILINVHCIQKYSYYYYKAKQTFIKSSLGARAKFGFNSTQPGATQPQFRFSLVTFAGGSLLSYLAACSLKTGRSQRLDQSGQACSRLCGKLGESYLLLQKT